MPGDLGGAEAGVRSEDGREDGGTGHQHRDTRGGQDQVHTCQQWLAITILDEEGTYTYLSFHLLIINSVLNRSSCALDFHLGLDKIFFTDIITQKIYSVNTDGTELSPLLSDVVVTPDGVAVDWVYSR